MGKHQILLTLIRIVNPANCVGRHHDFISVAEQVKKRHETPNYVNGGGNRHSKTDRHI